MEPFAGSACLFFARAPTNAVLADFNLSLINTYTILKNACEPLADALDLLAPNGEDYYTVRNAFNSPSVGVERAAQFIYLNRFGFNGVNRTNRQGHYNVPRGSRTGRLPTRVALRAASAALMCAELTSADFRETIRKTVTGDLLYVDPPYATTHRSTYGEYGYGAFGGTDDLSDLAVELEGATKRGVKVILSFGESAPLGHLLTNWHVSEFL